MLMTIIIFLALGFANMQAHEAKSRRKQAQTFSGTVAADGSIHLLESKGDATPPQSTSLVRKSGLLVIDDAQGAVEANAGGLHDILVRHAMPNPNGESCQQSSDCQSGFCTDANICTQPVHLRKKDGEPCAHYLDCQSQFCSDTNMCTFSSKNVDGERCHQHSDCRSQLCSAANVCTLPQPKSLPPMTVRATSASMLVPPTHVPPNSKNPNGGPCQQHFDCQSQLCADTKVCTQPAHLRKNDGEPCVHYLDCRSQFCSDTNVCARSMQGSTVIAKPVYQSTGAEGARVTPSDFHRQQRMPMAPFSSLMHASYRKQYTWTKNVLLHAAMLLIFLLFTMALAGAIVRLVDAFDIEILDQFGGARLYKWVFEAPDPDVAVEAVAGSHVFLDYHHLDVDLTSEAITALLTSHGCLKQVKPDITDILWDCIRQSARFMISKEKNNILLIRDSVVVRFSYRSHLLVEKVPGRVDEKPHYVIPTLDKIGAESPHKAAERWCTRSLDFSLKQVRFIESDEEVQYIDKYENLRVVERQFIVIVQLIQDNPQMPVIPDNQQLLWMPLSDIESHPRIPKHIAFAEVNLWVGGKLHPEADVRELDHFLRSHGVDTNGWTGMDGTSTPERLLNEINFGQCILKLEGRTVERIINLSALRLRRLCDEGEILLVEVGRRESNGAIKWRMKLPGTKQKVGETIEAAAHRTCKETLRLREDDYDIYPETSRECIKYASPSKTYPGIMTAYYMYCVNVDLYEETPFAPKLKSWVTWSLRKLERVSPRKIGTLWGE